MALHKNPDGSMTFDKAIGFTASLVGDTIIAVRVDFEVGPGEPPEHVQFVLQPDTAQALVDALQEKLAKALRAPRGKSPN